MSDRISIAIQVWLVGILFAGVATVMLFAGIMFFSLSHAYGGGPLPWINDALWPFLAGAAATKVMSGYVSRRSNGAFHAGPMVVGVGVGFLAGWIATFLLVFDVAAGFVLAGAVGPIGGAILGTLVNIKMHPLAVGAACATPVLMLIAFLVR